MLRLLTATEASLWLDFDELTKQRSRLICKEFRRIARQRGSRIRLEEDILNTWIEIYHQTARPVGQFKGVLPLRDWLAHGRYWNPRLGRPKYEVRDVFDLTSEMLSAMRNAI